MTKLTQLENAFTKNTSEKVFSGKHVENNNIVAKKEAVNNKIVNRPVKKAISRLIIIFLSTASIVSIADNHQNKAITIPFTEGMPGWEHTSFHGETLYKVVSENDFSNLSAISNGSASGLSFKREINIREFPYLNWSWKVINPMSNLSEEEKQGDDYAARVYVIIKDGWFFWQTKALNYVWSSRLPPLSNWPNAYAPDNTLMVPLRTATSPNQSWVREKRNVYEDLKQWLGKEVETVSAIAIMTDSDDGKQKTSAAYRNIFFSAQ